MNGRDESLRDQIIKAALELFREKGYHPTSLQDIITAARCSKGGFYHNFASKEDLLYDIHEAFINYELERGEATRRLPDTAARRLGLVMADLVESIDLYRSHVTVFFEERRFLSSAKFALIKSKRDRYEALVRDLVTEGVRNGEFRSDLDPALVTRAIFGMCNWTYQWLRRDGGRTARETGEEFSRMLLEGLQVFPSRGLAPP